MKMFIVLNTAVVVEMAADAGAGSVVMTSERLSTRTGLDGSLINVVVIAVVAGSWAAVLLPPCRRITRSPAAWEAAG